MDPMIVYGVPAIICIGLYFWYASIISRKNKALEALSSVDVQLQKRFDLVPNILKLAQRFMDHEKELLTRVVELRAKVQQPYSPTDPTELAAHLEASQALETGLGRLFALAENYPDLKSDATIIRAQETYEEVEGHISAARRYYNAAVSDLNNAVEIFPGSVIAGFARVKTMPFYEIDNPEWRKPVDVDSVMRL
ncbi:LemA family protein [Nisaea denitrificans]|uniref:LemA family protein n=1 Tax=Nisaea denitrificans TaxID=390877 RepID=UPI00041929C7|nr:LemA family protein [Nisaea denitrificans]